MSKNKTLLRALTEECFVQIQKKKDFPDGIIFVREEKDMYEECNIGTINIADRFRIVLDEELQQIFIAERGYQELNANVLNKYVAESETDTSQTLPLIRRMEAMLMDEELCHKYAGRQEERIRLLLDRGARLKKVKALPQSRQWYKEQVEAVKGTDILIETIHDKLLDTLYSISQDTDFAEKIPQWYLDVVKKGKDNSGKHLYSNEQIDGLYVALLFIAFNQTGNETAEQNICSYLKQAMEHKKVVVKREDVEENTGSYYRSIWERYHICEMRDGDSTLTPELLSVFMMPTVTRDDAKDSLEVLFDEKKRKFIRAKSGIGKTTFLQYIMILAVCETVRDQYNKLMSAKELSRFSDGTIDDHYKKIFEKRDEIIFPVYIAAEHFNRSQPDNLLKLADFYGKELTEDMIKNAYENGHLVLLIDSLDEIEESKLFDFNSKMKDLMNEYPDSRLVVTSRFAGMKNMVGGLDYLQISGFDKETMETYLGRIRDYVGREQVKRVEDLLERSEYAYELAQNPFMLTVMLDILQYTDSVSGCIGGIIQAIIERRLVKRQLPIEPSSVRNLLSYIAFDAMFLNGGEAYITKAMLIQKIRRARDRGLLRNVFFESKDWTDGEIDSMLSVFSCQSGIINVAQNRSGENSFVFQDRLIQCYLAAEFLVKLNLAACDEATRPASRRNIISVFGDDDVFMLYQDREQINLHHNIREIDRFVEKIKQEENTAISDEILLTAQILMSMGKTGFVRSLQRALLSYLIMMGFMTTDLDKKERLLICLQEIYDVKIGGNDIMNRHNTGEELEVLIRELLHID